MEEDSCLFSAAVTSEDHWLAWSQWQQKNSQPVLTWDGMSNPPNISLPQNTQHEVWTHTSFPHLPPV